jgi:hypothetical protein
MVRSVNVRFRTLRILIAVRPHTERVRIARPEEISRRIVQRQQRQSRLPAATKLSRSDMDVVVVLEARTMSLSSSRAELLSRAASRSPARAIASGGEGRGAHPRAADEQLVGGGQGVCALPESKGGRAYNGGRGACREAGERVLGGSDGMHARGPTQGLGAKGTRRAHVEHVAHVCDAGGVEAQRLVEGRRVLPSRREGMRCGGERCEPGGGRACGVVAAHKRHARGWPDSRLGGQGHARSARRTCRSCQ